MRRVAILIDGVFFLKRLPSVRPDVHEHIDGLHGGFGKPKNKDAKETEASEAE